MRSEPISDRPGMAVDFEVLASAVVHADSDQIRALRAKPGPAFGDPLPANALKHADEQTVAGLSAVLHAIANSGFDWQPGSFQDWGVLAAPQFLGRSTFLSAFERFSAEGAWGVSPHIVPHRSLHSVSGMISLVLQVHGPNFGVGGGPLAADEGFLAAAGLGQAERGSTIPFWLVLTQPAELVQLDPHAGSDDGERSGPANGGPPGQCHAVAMALVSAECVSTSPRLRVVPSLSASTAGSTEARPRFHLEALSSLLVGQSPAGTQFVWRLGCGGWIQYRAGGNLPQSADHETTTRPSKLTAPLAEVCT